MKAYNKSHVISKGFTLVELIVVIAIMGLFITVSGNLISVAMKAHKQTTETYTLQSAVRIASDKVTHSIRYSKAVFAVPKSFVSSVSKMDSAWHYFSVSPDKKQIIEYEYDTVQNKFIEHVLVPAQDNIYYELSFRKDYDPLSDGAENINERLLQYTITAYYGEEVGGNVVPKGDKIVFSSETEALNSIQVVDKGTYLDGAIAIAYRFEDPFSDDVSYVGTVSLVLDTSGSMSYTLGTSTRIEELRKALLGDGVKEGLIDILSKEPNIEVALVPFDSDANTVSYRVNSSSPWYYSNTFYNASSEKGILNMIAGKLSAGGGTNTGDGMRRAYHNHLNFVPENEGYTASTRKVNYMIILVDGETTYETRLNGGAYYTGSAEYNSSTMYRGGNGSTSMSNGAGSYVGTIGNLIKASSPAIKTYVIGFDASISTAVRQIGESAGTNLTENLHLYNSSTFDLSAVFSEIANDIVADLWLIMGPQIQ